jgi:mono/diheme cytochrome c family protein
MRVISRFAAAIFFIASPVLAQEDRAEAQRNPFAGDASAIAAGKALFDRACQNCHGPAGSGDRGPALTGALRRGDTDGMIFTNIRAGILGSEMPPFSRFSTEQTWQLVSYIRGLSAAAPRDSKSESVTGDSKAGRAVFEGKGQCLTCHQVEESGAPVGPDLSNASQLSAAEIEDLLAWLKTGMELPAAHRPPNSSIGNASGMRRRSRRTGSPIGAISPGVISLR